MMTTTTTTRTTTLLKQLSTVVWQKAASPSCQPSWRRMQSSVTYAGQGHSPVVAGEQVHNNGLARTLQKCPFLWVIWTAPNTWFLGPT